MAAMFVKSVSFVQPFSLTLYFRSGLILTPAFTCFQFNALTMYAGSQSNCQATQVYYVVEGYARSSFARCKMQ